jgi:hypothetical protein
MMYLTGAANAAIRADLTAGTVGLLKTPSTGYRLDEIAVWAMDNGCFTGKYPGDEAYLALLDSLAAHRGRCLFVTAPDVIADATATLALFPAMAERIRARGWPVALVGQDGMEQLPVPWHLVDWVFIGGSTDWKLGSGATSLIRQAKAHGKQVHVGRVNSGRRFARFHALGCDTADGTFLAFGPDVNALRLRDWMRAAAEPTLWFGGAW